MSDNSAVHAGIPPELLVRIADLAGTPTYAYFEERIDTQVERLRELFLEVPGRLLYAMKANSHPAIMSKLRSRGIGIDAVSPAELLLALRLGFSADSVLFSANNITDSEMQFAHHQGVLLNIGELSSLDRYGAAFPGSKVCVRLNPQVGAGHHKHVITAGAESKFGIPVAQSDDVKTILVKHDLQLAGLHQHIGSGIQDATTLWAAIEVILEAAADFPPVSFINLGGGLGIPYRPDEEGIDLTVVRESIGPRIREYSRRHSTEIWFEPGRFFVAQAGILLARVTAMKDNGDRVFVGLNTGMNHLIRPAIYDSYHGIVNVSNPSGPVHTYDIVGNICETGDTFARARPVAEIREGDILALLDTGAYGMSMSSAYNLRGRPAEVWISSIESGRFEILTHRLSAAETVNALIGASRVPSHLHSVESH